MLSWLRVQSLAYQAQTACNAARTGLGANFAITAAHRCMHEHAHAASNAYSLLAHGRARMLLRRTAVHELGFANTFSRSRRSCSRHKSNIACKCSFYSLCKRNCASMLMAWVTACPITACRVPSMPGSTHASEQVLALVPAMTGTAMQFGSCRTCRGND